MTNETLKQTTLEPNIEDDSSYEEEPIVSRPKRSKPTQFPTDKPGHYSKDRRYVPIPKKSDAEKLTVRSGTGKGSKNKKKGNTTP